MKIQLTRQNKNFHFIAKNEDNSTISIDASPNIGGENLGMRPMQLLLAGLGGCSGIDIINILKKQKQEVEEFEIEVDGEREPNKDPSLFQDIQVKFILKGNIDPDKARRAVDLSMQKYCSVAKILEATAQITYQIELNTTVLE